MKFFVTVRTADHIPPSPPPPALMEAIAGLGMEAQQKGTLVETGALFQTARVALANGDIGVTDGPYTEAKELVGGYAIFSFDSIDEAVAHSRRFLDAHKQHWPGWEGDVEVRQLVSDFDPAGK